MISETIQANEQVSVGAKLPGMLDRLNYKVDWTICKYKDEFDFQKGVPFAVNKFDGNLLLNEGITELLTLLSGGGGTAFNNANSYIAVGDSTTAEAASQTDLQAASNKTYKAMSATYPQVSGQSITFRSAFASGDANYSWQEFSVANGSSGTAKNLNRKVSNQGTKVAGQVWTLDVTITLG